MYTTTGEKIVSFRKSRGLSQKGLAMLAGMKPQQLHQYEKGIHIPSLETIRKIADALRVPFYDLVGDDSDYQPVAAQAFVNDLYRADLLAVYDEFNDMGKRRIYEIATDYSGLEKYTTQDEDLLQRYFPEVYGFPQRDLDILNSMEEDLEGKADHVNIDIISEDNPEKV